MQEQMKVTWCQIRLYERGYTITVPTSFLQKILDTSCHTIVETEFETVEESYKFACAEKTKANHFSKEDYYEQYLEKDLELY